jgi:hypothetical protein
MELNNTKQAEDQPRAHTIVTELTLATVRRDHNKVASIANGRHDDNGWLVDLSQMRRENSTSVKAECQGLKGGSCDRVSGPE